MPASQEKERKNLQILQRDCAGLCLRFLKQQAKEMQGRSYLPDSKAVLCCNLASFFISSFMQLHEKIIREDRSLGRCKNHDTEEKPRGRLPLGGTATFHLSLGVKSGARRRAGWWSRGPRRKVQIRNIYIVFVCLFFKRNLCVEKETDQGLGKPQIKVRSLASGWQGSCVVRRPDSLAEVLM